VVEERKNPFEESKRQGSEDDDFFGDIIERIRERREDQSTPRDRYASDEDLEGMDAQQDLNLSFE
jgi:hypothetical protein